MSALSTWLAALALALILAGLGTGLDDMDAMREVQASVQDAQATAQRGQQARRDAAAAQICGPNATPRWIDETTLSCHQVERMASIAYALSQEAAQERRQVEQQAKARP